MYESEDAVKDHFMVNVLENVIVSVFPHTVSLKYSRY